MKIRPLVHAVFTVFTVSVLAWIVAAAPAVRSDESSAAVKVDAAKLAAVADSLAPFVERNEIAGAVTAVAWRDGVKVQAVGKADLAGDEPMRPDTVFWIASMTKPVTAVAVMMMQDEGKLSVEDPVGKYVP